MKMKLDIVDIMDALQSGVNAQILIKEIYDKALCSRDFDRDFDRDWLVDVIEDYMNGDE